MNQSSFYLQLCLSFSLTAWKCHFIHVTKLHYFKWTIKHETFLPLVTKFKNQFFLLNKSQNYLHYCWTFTLHFRKYKINFFRNWSKSNFMLRLCHVYHLHNLKIWFAPEYTTGQKSAEDIYVLVLFVNSRLPSYMKFVLNNLENSDLKKSVNNTPCSPGI